MNSLPQRHRGAASQTIATTLSSSSSSSSTRHWTPYMYMPSRATTMSLSTTSMTKDDSKHHDDTAADWSSMTPVQSLITMIHHTKGGSPSHTTPVAACRVWYRALLCIYGGHHMVSRDQARNTLRIMDICAQLQV